MGVTLFFFHGHAWHGVGCHNITRMSRACDPGLGARTIAEEALRICNKDPVEFGDEFADELPEQYLQKLMAAGLDPAQTDPTDVYGIISQHPKSVEVASILFEAARQVEYARQSKNDQESINIDLITENPYSLATLLLKHLEDNRRS